MAVEITMPKWGLTMKQGTISKWLKQEGDSVRKGEELFEVETEKVTNIVESIGSGLLYQIVVKAGNTVPCGTILAVLVDSGEKPNRVEGIQVGDIVEGQAPKAAAASQPELRASVGSEPRQKGYVPASPAAKRLAKELGIDLSQVPGTGPKGRVSESDVKKYHEEGPPAPPITPVAEELARQSGLDISSIKGSGEGGKITKRDVENALTAKAAKEENAPVKTIPLTGIRKKIADNMRSSLHNAAQLSIFTEVDVTEMVVFRNMMRDEYAHDDSIRISFNDIIVMATSRALKRFPIMNSNLVEDKILCFDSVHMGIAVALPEGLIVPVLRNADKKGLLQIAGEARQLAQKARDGVLEVEEVTGGTFTITNVSMFQVDGFTPILKPPETGILGIGRIKEKPAVYKGEITIRSMMFLSLTFDHQVVDGVPANDFLQTVARYLERPQLIMS